jgi:hypothetical protein
MTATALPVFLTTSHSKMPNLILAPQQIADVSAYILSLRERRGVTGTVPLATLTGAVWPIRGTSFQPTR